MPVIAATLPDVVMDNAVAATPVVPAVPVPAAPVYFNPVPPYAAAPVPPIETREEPAMPVNLDSAVKASELQVIMAAIQSTDSRMEAAAKLGISPRTLRYKLAQMRTRGMTEGASA